MHIEPIPRWVVLGSGTAVAIAATLVGRLPARIVASMVVIYLVVDFAHIHPPLIGVPVGTVGFLTCLGVALRSRGYWTVWAAASQLLTLVTELIRPLPEISEWAYFSAQVTWFFVLLAALLFGAFADRPGAPPAARGPTGR
jgi:hypothetical protein